MKIAIINNWKILQFASLNEYTIPALPKANILLTIFKAFLLLIMGFFVSFLGIMSLAYDPGNFSDGVVLLRSPFLLWSRPYRLTKAAGFFYKKKKYLESAICFLELFKYKHILRFDPKYKIAYKLITQEKCVTNIPPDILNTLKDMLFLNMWQSDVFHDLFDQRNKIAIGYYSELPSLVSESESFSMLIKAILEYIDSSSNEHWKKEVKAHLKDILKECPKCLSILDESNSSCS